MVEIATNDSGRYVAVGFKIQDNGINLTAFVNSFFQFIKTSTSDMLNK